MTWDKEPPLPPKKKKKKLTSYICVTQYFVYKQLSFQKFDCWLKKAIHHHFSTAIRHDFSNSDKLAHMMWNMINKSKISLVKLWQYESFYNKFVKSKTKLVKGKDEKLSTKNLCIRNLPAAQIFV